MRKQYNKLVRDHIPAIISTEGRAYEITTLQDDEYRKALLEKLAEEAVEAQNAQPRDLLVELADLQEVIDSLLMLHNITSEELRSVQQERHRTRGGFSKRIKLLWAE